MVGWSWTLPVVQRACWTTGQWARGLDRVGLLWQVVTAIKPQVNMSEPHPIVDVIQRQVGAWNAGDLDEYMQYVHPDVVYLSETGLTRGAETVRASYAKSFASGMGQLSVEVIELEEGDAQVSCVLSFSLSGAARDGRGHALVVYVSTRSGWRMRYDATLRSE
ncbi:MAG: ketosteroid isomerase-like protein [Kiritimatiellia bacterium]|jgi:ketosteroid isomerase-like protein